MALRSFAAHPLAGVGSGGFRAEWRRERKIDDPARDAHSLYLETLGELGRRPVADLVSRFGERNGRALHERAHFHDDGAGG